MLLRRLMLPLTVAVFGSSLFVLPAVAQREPAPGTGEDNSPPAFNCRQGKFKANPSLQVLVVKGFTREISCVTGYKIAKVTGTFTVSTAAQRVLGRGSRVIASGALVGPSGTPPFTPTNPPAYTLRFTSAMRTKLRAKRVALLTVSPEFKVTSTKGDVDTIPAADFAGKINFLTASSSTRGCTVVSGLWYSCEGGGLKP